MSCTMMINTIDFSQTNHTKFTQEQLNGMPIARDLPNYERDYGSVWLYDINDEEKTFLFEDVIIELSFDGENIIYLNDDNYICGFDLDKNIKEILLKETVIDFEIVYSEQKILYKDDINSVLKTLNY